MNNYSFIGNLGKDPELRYLESGTAVCNFSAATSAGFGDNKSTTWVKCTAWGKTAEIIEKHFSKGSRIGVVGEIKTGEYEKDGTKFHTWECVVRDFSFVDKKQGGGGSSSGPSLPDQSFDDEDIPF